MTVINRAQPSRSVARPPLRTAPIARTTSKPKYAAPAPRLGPVVKPVARVAAKPLARVAKAPARLAAPVKRVARVKEAVTANITPIKEKLTKSELYDKLVDYADLPHVNRKEVKAVMESLEEIILGSLHPKGVGEFTMSGVFKIFAKEKKGRVQEAIKPGTLMTNKFTGVEYKHEGRPRTKIPSSMVCKIRPQTKLKLAVIGK